MRRQLYLSVILLGASLALSAEDASPDRVNVPLTDPSRPAVVNASLMNGGITVTGYAGTEVIVEARPRGHESESKPDRKAEGMHRLDSRGTGLSVEEQDNQVNIGVREMNRTVDLTIQVPFKTSLKLKCLNDGNIQVDHVSGEIDANDLNGGVKLTNISGSAVAHSLNEDVTVTFDQVTPGKAMSFSTMNGDIDVSLPADTKARVKMKADNGEIYSDFEVRQEPSPAGTKVTDTGRKDGRFRVQFEKALYGSINGGGPEMQFTTFNGKIYLRKKK
jgi:DUF4097 and DUF4098 domain-containing protein YvlB